MRVGALNVGTMHPFQSVMCLVTIWPMTRWKGNKAQELGRGYKLLHGGANEQGQNGVGIVKSKEMKDNLIMPIPFAKPIWVPGSQIQSEVIPGYATGDMSGPRPRSLHRHVDRQDRIRSVSSTTQR